MNEQPPTVDHDGAPVKPDSLPLESFRRYVALHFQIEEQKAKLAELTKQRDALEAVCDMALAESGVRNVPLVHEGQPVTVYRSVTLRTQKLEGVETRAVCEWMKQCGLEWMVAEAYNASRLSGWVREELAENRTLPEQFGSFFKVAEDPSVNVIRATSEGSKSQRAAANYRDQLRDTTIKGS